jgi:hypothetical protein
MPLLLLQHLGLGDHIICNAMVREIARANDELFLLAKTHNVPSVKFMFSDLSNVKVISVTDDDEARKVVKSWQRQNLAVMLNGLHNPNWTDETVKFDQAFYEMAEMPFEYRWERFSVPRDLDAEERIHRILAPKGQYIFLHDDSTRQFNISSRSLPKNMTVVKPPPGLTNNIFHYRKIIEEAAEVHCIPSSFAHWIENACIGKKRYLHQYARPDGTWGTFRNFLIVHDRHTSYEALET